MEWFLNDKRAAVLDALVAAGCFFIDCAAEPVASQRRLTHQLESEQLGDAYRQVHAEAQRRGEEGSDPRHDMAGTADQ